jgi:hypothetical protein
LQLSALQAAIAAAVSSGSNRFEAVVVVGTAGALAAGDASLLRDVGNPTVHSLDPDGAVHP